MEKKLKEQKEAIRDDVLELRRKCDSLVYVLNKAKTPEAQTVVILYGEFLSFLIELMMESLVIQITRLFHCKDRRGLFWYLKNSTWSDEKVMKLKSDMLNLRNDNKRLQFVRDKWIAHKDSVALTNPANFTANPIKQDVLKPFVDLAYKIITDEGEIVDNRARFRRTERLFSVIESLETKYPDLKLSLKEFGLFGDGFGAE